MQRYQMTGSPKLFKNTYWGSGSHDGSEDSIYSNRDWFVKEYDIKRSRIPTKKLMKYMNSFPLRVADHVEYYKDSKGRDIIVSSPYCPDVDNLPVGWEVLERPLYGCGATTLIRVMP